MKNKLLYFLLVLFSFSALIGCADKGVSPRDFVRVEDSRLYLGGKPYYYIGTNVWYAAILGSQGEGGNRERLETELKNLAAIGVKNLRILVGADGEKHPAKVYPTLQTAPGVYNEEILDGLDYLMMLMDRYDMKAVLYLNNSWLWSGGYCQYLEWAGCEPLPQERVSDWESYKKYASQFVTSDAAKTLFKQHVRFILSRTNSYTGRKYTEDPAIMAWQIGNEPRAFSQESKPALAQWLAEIAEFIKSIDSNHLLSVGSEGEVGCEGDIELWREIHTDRNIDYLTMHVWPKNWKWLDVDDFAASYDSVIGKTDDYLRRHVQIAEELRKPLVIEEFGLPRDNNAIDRASTTLFRDKYYTHIFSKVAGASAAGSCLSGCNFWTWGGVITPAHADWQFGDDYVGDPVGEAQGLNSVFSTDSTIEIIKQYQRQLSM